MRRSAAPSQLGGATKRPRFSCPLASSKGVSQQTDGRTMGDILQLIAQATPDYRQEPCVDSLLSSPQNLPGRVVNEEQDKQEEDVAGNAVLDKIDANILLHENKSATSTAKLGTFHAPTLCSKTSSQHGRENCSLSQSSPPKTSHEIAAPKVTLSAEVNLQRPKSRVFTAPGCASKSRNEQKLQGTATETQTVASAKHHDSDLNIPKNQYFAVMWCKLSKKKHKKWEGDAVLVTKGREVKLLDMDAKEIGRGTGYKKAELLSLAEGQTLLIGGKEIEVMGSLAEEDFTTGKCFTGGSTIQSSPQGPAIPAKLAMSKPFSKPQKSGSAVNSKDQPLPSQTVKPRYDPDAPGALVVPRPGQAHQFEHNKGYQNIVDVVVDPYVSRHLRPHQRAGVVFMYECVMGMKNYPGQGVILADEMGLGKTIQCIALLWTLLKQGPYGGKPVIKKALVITPGSLVKNWLREFKKWLGVERLKVYAVSQDNPVQTFLDSPMYPVLVISYEMFMRNVEVLQRINFDLLVCDEGHRLKNTTIKTTTLVSSLNTRRRIILSGTPVQNDLQELHAIVEFCNPGILGSAAAFRRVYEDPILVSRRPDANAEETDIGQTRAAELNRITGMFILRRTSDINNKYLPPKVDQVLFCRPSPLQLSVYKALVSSRLVRSCLTTQDSAQHLMCISALRKLSNHPSLLYQKAADVTTTASNNGTNPDSDLYHGLLNLYPDNYDHASSNCDDSGKLVVLEQMLNSFHESSPMERVVLVSNYTQALNVLEKLCQEKGYSFLRLDGKTPTTKRQQLVERFNSSYSTDFVFLLSTKAGGVGLNLVGASRLILYDIDWNPANDLQAMARVWRDGQRSPVVYIYRLLTSGTIEEKMYQRQVAKQGLSGAVVDAKNCGQVKFSQEELKDLFVLQENTKCETHSMLGCDCDRDNQDTDNVGCQPNSSGSVSRPRQLGQSGSGQKRNLGMEELMQWSHETGPSPTMEADSVLAGTDLSGVSFLFYCKSNATAVKDTEPI